jgi:hypothetical protein
MSHPNVSWGYAIVGLGLYMNQGLKEESGPSNNGKSENKGGRIIRLSSFLIQGCDVLLVNVLFILIIIIRYILIM